MLRLLVFVPCEKLIVGDQGQPSLIGVIELITVNVTTVLAADALIPFRWSFMTLFERVENVDQPVAYEEEVRLVRPDGSEAAKVFVEFVVTNEHPNYRQHGDVGAFPAGQEGKHLLELFLRKKGEEDWQKLTSYPIHVRHVRVEKVKQGEQEDQP